MTTRKKVVEALRVRHGRVEPDHPVDTGLAQGRDRQHAGTFNSQIKRECLPLSVGESQRFEMGVHAAVQVEVAQPLEEI